MALGFHFGEKTFINPLLLHNMIRKVSESKNGLVLKVIPFGPNEEAINTLSHKLLKHNSVRRYLDKTRYRLLYCELNDPDIESKAEHKSALPNGFRATFYDYTNNRTIYANGLFDERNNMPKAVEISESSIQPLPSKEEFDEAVKILHHDKATAIINA
jgi:hypothetical protein